MSPILVRPVREQLEHDRVVRLLLTRYRRRFDIGINPGAEQNVPVGSGLSALYPDAVLSSTDRGHRLQAVVEVESGESVNHLEALSQWKPFAALRAAFHLYVPAGSVDRARRLLAEHEISCAELWSYHTIGDQMRFTLVSRGRAESGRAKAARRTARAGAAKAPAAARRSSKGRTAAKPVSRTRTPRAGKTRASKTRTAKTRAARPKKSTARKPSRAQKRK